MYFSIDMVICQVRLQKKNTWSAKNFKSTPYYKLANVCVCVPVCVYVCMCVCVYVCLSVRLYVSTFLNGSSPNLEGTFYGSWHVSWAIYFVVCICAFAYFWTDSLHICLELNTNHHKWQGLRTVYVHTPRARMRDSMWLSVRLHMDGFSSNSRWTYYKSHQVAWATYCSC
jgi:hypothetical protein